MVIACLGDCWYKISLISYYCSALLFPKTIHHNMPLDSFGLGPERSFDQITYLDFQHLCSNYGKANRDTFENLDYFRLSTVPEILQQRKQDGCPFMEKSELQILAEWRRFAALTLCLAILP